MKADQKVAHTEERHPRNGAPCTEPEHEHVSRQDAKSCGCPHEWPEDIHEPDGGHYCLLCGTDGLS